MKHWFLWLLLTGVLTAHAQALPDTAAQSVRAILTRHVHLKGWRYHAGNNPAWAQPGFEAGAWDTLDRYQPRYRLPAAVQTGGFWLRWRFRRSGSLRRQPLAVSMTRLGSLDVYLNGQLVTDSARRARTSGALSLPEPILLPAGGPAEQVLAVHYVSAPPSLLSRWMPLLVVGVFTPPQLRQQEAWRSCLNTVFLVAAALSLLLALQHAAYYRYNPSRPANRYFARAMLAYCLANLSLAGLYGTAVWPSWAWVLVLQVASSLLRFAAAAWALRTTYLVFGFARGRLWGGVLAALAGLLLLSSALYFSPWQELVTYAASLVLIAELVRLAGRALRQRRPGARVVAAGYAAGLLALLGYVGLQTTGLAFSTLNLLALGFLLTTFLLAPLLGYALYLAREFAQDAELLLVKLHEVEQLSAQTLRQEQEKQALLAGQNERLEAQVSERTAALHRSLTELQTTQQQLIQKEKMASLGELTAGIAHEIQNPLNFVTNFADVSTELVAELKQAQTAGDTAEVVALADDLGHNLTKISQHGQRASGIVRGMLAHSRASTGERQPTNVNALCQEYLRLAYHGLQAKEQSFTVELHTDFASPLPLVVAVAGDLGRVLLNLFANAFYAVQQRQRLGEAGYVPTVRVQTRQLGQQVEILVQDNGTGMSAEVQAKVFQPFFTTKPPGEGTGLGLSLSYDIITHGHGGLLTVESQVGQGSTFRISLPLV